MRPDAHDEPLEVAAPYRSKRQASRQLPVRPRLALTLLLGALGAAAWESAATLRQHFGAASDADYRAAVERLKVLHRPGEPILFAPHWMEPLGQLHFGEVVPFELSLLSDVDRYPRVWQVSVRGHRHPFLTGFKPSGSYGDGPVRIELFEKPAEEVLFDFTRQWQGARVERVGDKVVRCPLEGKRFACPGAGWNAVKPQLAEVGHRPYRCVYAHPVEGHLMRVRFAEVPLGKRIVGYTGIDDFENRKRSDAPVLLTVRVGGRLAGQVAHQNKWPWRRFELDTGLEAGKRAEVIFEISAEKAYARTFCFAAEARR